VLWLPFGLVAHIWPTGDWGSALLTVSLAYFLGHLMLYLSTKVIPSYDVNKSTDEKTRYPSETVLDGDSSALPKELREKIAEAVRSKFKLEVHVENSTGDFDGVRACRISSVAGSLVFCPQFTEYRSGSRGEHP
jgi:hypothetical protein